MGEHENILQTIKSTLQDFVAPDVRENKVQLASLRQEVQVLSQSVRQEVQSVRQEVQVRFDPIDARLDAQDSRSEAQFKALLATIDQSKAENELFVLKQIAVLSERVAALEATRH